MAKKQVLPVIGKAAPLAKTAGAMRRITKTAMPTPGRMKAGRGISNGVKPGKPVGGY